MQITLNIDLTNIDRDEIMLAMDEEEIAESQPSDESLVTSYILSVITSNAQYDNTGLKIKVV